MGENLEKEWEEFQSLIGESNAAFNEPKLERWIFFVLLLFFFASKNNAFYNLFKSQRSPREFERENKQLELSSKRNSDHSSSSTISNSKILDAKKEKKVKNTIIFLLRFYSWHFSFYLIIAWASKKEVFFLPFYKKLRP